MDEAGDRGVQLEAPVVSPFEAREVPFGIIGADLSIGAENVSATTENAERNHFPRNRASRQARIDRP